MERPRLTIARWMGWTAVLAVNAALVRAFIVQEMFCGGILIFLALQIGLWCRLRGRGRARRFWLGFEVAGVAATLALFSCEVFPESAPSRVVMAHEVGDDLGRAAQPPAGRGDQPGEVLEEVGQVHLVAEPPDGRGGLGVGRLERGAGSTSRNSP